MYLHDIETKYHREERNTNVPIDGPESGNAGSLSIFSQKVRPLGTAYSHKLADTLMVKARWYILNDCPEVEQYIEYVHPS